tara:strand:- start:4205 stop:6283 length:2079 start_codon:yes stop_codon:yes gene_type:complete
MYSNTILKLDLIIIIIQKYCEKYLKNSKNIDIKKSKTIKFVLEQINDIKKTKDFKVLKSIFTIEKKYKIKDIKDWLSILCVNKTELFSKHFKLEVEIDLTKSYRTYVNLLSKLGVNKTKCDLKTSTKKISTKKISILFNLLFYNINIIDGGGRIRVKTYGNMRDKELFDKLNPLIKFLSKDDLHPKTTTLKRLGPPIKKENGLDPKLLAKLTPICKLFKNNRNRDQKKMNLKDLTQLIIHLKQNKTYASLQWAFLYRAFENMALREQWFLLNAQGVQDNPQPKLIASSIGLTNKETEHIKKYSDIWYDFFNTKGIANFVRFEVRQSYLNDFANVEFENLKIRIKQFISNMDISDGVTYIPYMELIIYYAILLNFWTKNGDEWVKKGSKYKHSEGKFTKDDIDTFMFAMFRYMYMELLQGEERIEIDIKMSHIFEKIGVLKDSDETGTFVGMLSLLTHFFYKEVTKDYEKSITVYFAKKLDIIKRMLNPDPDNYILPQSASYEFTVAAIDFNDYDVIGIMRLLPSDYLHYPYIGVPLSFISSYMSEREVLCISNDPFLSSENREDYKDYLTNTSTIILKNLKGTFENVLRDVLACNRTTQLKQNVTKLVLFNKLQIVGSTYTSIHNHLLESILLGAKTKSILAEQNSKLEITHLDDKNIEIDMKENKEGEDIKLNNTTEIQQLDSIIQLSTEP